MEMSALVAEFWQRFCNASTTADPARFYEAFYFGDSEEMANALAALVLQGIKRGTAGSLWSYEHEGKRPPEPGDFSIVTDGSGMPLCVIVTTQVDVVPFKEVTPEFAAIEGEGDGSLEYWREAHIAFFSRDCARMGRVFSEDMRVACEQFKVVFAG